MKNESKVIWSTGLSGSGKTTLSNILYDKLIDKGYSVIEIDGDIIRSYTDSKYDFSPQGIRRNNKNIIKLCLEYMVKYNFVLVSVISPFGDMRNIAKTLLVESYIEVYVKASLETVIARDVKGLYEKALNSEISNFIGIDSKVPYEIPESPSIIINTETESEETSINRLIKYFGVI